MKLYNRYRNLILIFVVGFLIRKFQILLLNLSASFQLHFQLVFQANEIERLSAWLNPLGEALGLEDANIEQWRKSTFPDARTEAKLLRENVRIAWQICPDLAVYMPSRQVIL